MSQQEETKTNISQIVTEGLIAKIDTGLSEYYKKFEIDYKNEEEIGKFEEFTDANGFDDLIVYDELKVDPSDCMLVDFDEEFPLEPDIDDAAEEILRILNSIALRGFVKTRPKRHVDLTLQMINDISQDEIQAAMAKYTKQMSCFTKQAEYDRDLQYFLGIGVKYDFPFLTYMVDSYTKDKVLQYSNNKNEVLTVSEWARENPFMIALRMNNPKKAISLEHAITGYCGRIMNRIQFASAFRIMDKLKAIAQYVTATALFIQKLMDKLHGKAPFQVDLLIAVNGIKTTVPEHKNEQKDDDEYDVIIESMNPNIDYIGHVQQKLQGYPLHYFPNDNWDVEDTEQSSEFIARLFAHRYNEFRSVLSKFNIDNSFNAETYPQYRRFAIFVDRRENKPTNDNENKDNKDQVTYFQPPNHCNTMEVDHVPEIGFEFVRKCIIPEKVEYKEQNITANDGLCGQLLTFMFCVEQDEEIRCYLVWNGQTMRFQSEHILKLLPILFVDSEENLEFKNCNEAKKMEEMFDNVSKDYLFDSFYTKLTSFE
eukprot:220036_1